MLVNKRLGRLVSLLGSVLWLSACQSEPEALVTPPTESVQNPSEFYDLKNIPDGMPTYVVGTMGSYAPFEFRDQNGQSIGFDMDIIHAIASKQKFKVTVVTHPWDGILETLNTGERDIIISTVNITPERQQRYDFSLPYFSLQDVLLTKNSQTDLNSFQDVLAKQSKVATLTGSYQNALLLQHGLKPEHAIRKDSQFLAVKAMFNGEVEAVIGDGPVMEYFALTYNDIPTKSFYLPNAETATLGIAVKKGNLLLLNQLNTGLKQIQANGTYEKIYNKWFRKPVPAGFLPWTDA